MSLRPKTGIPKVPNMQWGHIFGGENAFPSSLNEPRQVGGPQNQNSLHTNQDEGHDRPTTKKVSFGPNFEYGDIPKNPNKLLEHGIASPNAFTGALTDFPQLGGTQKQNSQHASICENHSAPTGPIEQKGHIFGCGDIPKMPNKLWEHGIASPSAFTGPLNDFPQLGGTQNQNSQHASICEHHSVPAGPTEQKGHNFGYGDIPKMLAKLVKHCIACPSVFPNPLSEFSQVEGPQNQNSQQAKFFEGHDMSNSSNLHVEHISKCQKSCSASLSEPHRVGGHANQNSRQVMDLVEEDGVPFYLRKPADILRREFEDFAASGKMATLLSLTTKQNISSVEDIIPSVQEVITSQLEDMSLNKLLKLINEQPPSKRTAMAVAVAAKNLTPASATEFSLLTTATIALLTCSHEMSQTAAARFLSDSVQSGERWQFITIAAIQAASVISQEQRATPRAKSLRHLIDRAILCSPATAVIAAVETCRGARVPLHVSQLLEKWALKYTSSGEAPAWHQVLASLQMDDKIHISEHAPTRVSIHLLGTTRAGDPATQLLWNVNGLSSRWRSSQVVLEKDMASVVAGNVSQTKKKRQLKRRIAKADFKTMIVTAGCPDFLTIVESKLSLAKMMALPGFISWCENMGYHHIALSWSTNESKGGAGYVGIMTLSKVRPISTTFDFEGVPTEEARCVTHEFESFIHVGLFTLHWLRCRQDGGTCKI